METMTRRRLLGSFALLGLASCDLPTPSPGSPGTPGASSASSSPGSTSPPSSGGGGLEVLEGGFPRAIFFRQTETAGDHGYEAWADQFRLLNGIEGKLFDEEKLLDPEPIQAYFKRFKKEHPEKLAMLHFNGKARRPKFNGDAFSARHWLYFAGTTVTSAAGASSTSLRVRDVGVFAMARGEKFKEIPDDIVIVPPRSGSGGFDWERAEQVRLTGIDKAASTITVKRNFYGFTDPIEIPAGSYIAPHARERPPVLDKTDEVLWPYNFAESAVDAKGRTCGDALAAELAAYFASGGALDGLDGLQFDVLFFTPAATGFVEDAHLIDVDNDGRADRGFVDGANVYGKGVLAFAAELRKRLPDKLILADGMLPELHQRCFGLLNGMESEGFPTLRDTEFREWSSGLNQHEFWRTRGSSPRFGYLLHKYVKQRNRLGKDPGAYAKARLAMAAAAFTDETFAVGGQDHTPPPVEARETGAQIRVFDELVRGRDQQPNWLGRPLGPARHLADDSPDLLNGAAARWEKTLSPPSSSRSRTTDTGAPVHTVELPFEASHRGGDLTVVVEMSGRPVEGYPAGIARRVGMKAYVDGREVPVGDPKRPKATADTLYTWVDAKPFRSRFLFKGAPKGKLTLTLVVEGSAELVVRRLTVHASTDAVIRVFENGVVLANPSESPYTFDLRKLVPRRRFRRIAGNPEQKDRRRVVNNGRPVQGRVRLQGLDGLFLAERVDRKGS